MWELSAVRWADWIDECTKETLKMEKPKRIWDVGAHQPGTEVTRHLFTMTLACRTMCYLVILHYGTKHKRASVRVTSWDDFVFWPFPFVRVFQWGRPG